MANQQCECGEMDFQHAPDRTCKARKGPNDSPCGCAGFKAIPPVQGCWVYKDPAIELLQAELRALAAVAELRAFIDRHTRG